MKSGKTKRQLNIDSIFGKGPKCLCASVFVGRQKNLLDFSSQA